MADTGRPSTYSPQMADSICEKLLEGESLRAICSEEDMPGAATVFRWLAKFPQFREQYARAREAAADAIFDEMFGIMDDGQNDWMEKEGKDGETFTVVNHEHIQRSKLRFEGRRWMLGKLNPKKYGDKIQQELSNPDGSLTGQTPEQVAKRLAAIEVKARAKKDSAPDDTDSDLADLC